MLALEVYLKQLDFQPVFSQVLSFGMLEPMPLVSKKPKVTFETASLDITQTCCL